MVEVAEECLILDDLTSPPCTADMLKANTKAIFAASETAALAPARGEG